MPLFPCRFHCIYLCLCVSVCAQHAHSCAHTQMHGHKRKQSFWIWLVLPRPAEELQVTAVTCCPVIFLSFSTPLVTCHSLRRVQSASSRYLIGRGFLLLLSVLLCLFVSYSDSLLESPKVSHYPALYVEVWGRSFLIWRKSVIIST